MLKKIILGLLLFSSLWGFSQGSLQETSVSIPYLSFSYGAYIPGGDLDERFGFTNFLGLSFNYKSPKNLVLGLGGGMFFGNDVREPNLLHAMRNQNGQILDDNAIESIVLFTQRGFAISVEIGKVVKIGNINPNTGLLFKLGLGYNQNKIRIENQENMIPQLSKEIKQFYDRQTGGFLLTEFIGYQFFSNKGLANFNAGFEFMQGFNSDLRSYNIDDQAATSEHYLNLYYGIKVGWSILFRKRDASSFYYN